jgi:hypothetical protein
MTFRERLTRGDKDVLRLFVEDAKAEGMSLRAYCKKHGVDYYLLTGFPRPWQEVPLQEGLNGEEGTGRETDV